MKKYVLTFCSLFLSLSLRAEEIELNPSHPQQYVVVSGDTLWDIAGKFLKNPWQWTTLWQQNPQVKNPHLIYPNDILFLTMVDGKPQLNLTSNHKPEDFITPETPCILHESKKTQGRTRLITDKQGKLVPCIRESELEQPVKMIPTEKIEHFLSSPKVVTEEELAHAPYVIGFTDGHILAGAGDKVYVKKLTDFNAKNYTIYRAGDVYISPETQEILGYEAKYVAEAELDTIGNPATLLIERSDTEIRTGDRIMPKVEDDFVLNFFPHPPKEVVNAKIISVLGGVSQIGQYNVVVIDKGAAEGLAIGHELAIYQSGQEVVDTFNEDDDEDDNEGVVKLPDERAGTLMIFRTFEHISYALVMKATHSIHLLDIAKTP